MNITFKKSITWKKIYYITLDKDRKILKKNRLTFNKNITNIEVNLDVEKYIYFTNGKQVSETIILSNLLDVVELIFNHKTRKYTCNLSLSNHDDYGTIRTFKIEDKVNLSFRRDKSKVINIWTPSNYDSTKEYGLIILFDSQNIFDINKFGLYTKRADPFGGWQTEATIENAIKKYGDEYIIVGIDDSDKYRMFELMVGNNSLEPKKEFVDKYGISKKEFKKANVDKFGVFITETLLPLVENEYKIKKYNIGICGSSAGGNAALYLGIKYSNIFRFIFSLTPAIGFYTDESLIEFYKKHLVEDKPQPEVYFFQGVKCDLEKLLFHLNTNLVKDLLKAGLKEENLVSYIEPTAEHNEDAWRYVFNYFMDLHCQKSSKY